MQYTRIVLGGTFDHFHSGHQSLLDAALMTAETVSLGITLPVLYQQKPFASSIESYAEREYSVKEYLRENHALERVTIVPIHDVWGTTRTDPKLKAILVTPATKANAKRVNIERVRHGILPLPIVIVPLLRGDDGGIISSERIRSGEINRYGTSYRTLFLYKKKYVLPTELRTSLQNPFGNIITEIQDLTSYLTKETRLFSVGDVVSLSLQNAGYTPLLSIIDRKTQRQNLDAKTIARYFPNTKPLFYNAPGTISKEIIPAYDRALKKHAKTNSMQVIMVDGEEDLLALPVMLFAPLNSIVVYGLQDLGMVIVRVTEDLKGRVQALLKQF